MFRHTVVHVMLKYTATQERSTCFASCTQRRMDSIEPVLAHFLNTGIKLKSRKVRLFTSQLHPVKIVMQSQIYTSISYRVCKSVTREQDNVSIDKGTEIISIEETSRSGRGWRLEVKRRFLSYDDKFPFVLFCVVFK